MRVVVVGAGVAGLAIGWRLRQAGAEVTVLERSQAALGATWASAGMIAVAGEMGHEQSPEAGFGRDASALWPDFAAEVEKTSGLSVDYRRSGTLLVAMSQAEAGSFAPSPGTGSLGVEEMRRLEPMLAPVTAGALWAPGDAQVDNRRLGQALAAAFTASGGNLSLNEAAVRFDVWGDKVTALHTPFARYEADAFLIAAGAWSGAFGGLPPEVLPPVRPIKGQMIAVAPPAGARLPRHLVRGNGVYIVPRADRILIGATVEDVGFDTAVTDAGVDWLSDRALGLMPSLAHWDIVERWAGLRPGSPDGRPILGPTALENLYVATGQYRNGILFAPAVADFMSRLVLGHAAVLPAFDPRRFQSEPPRL